MKTLAEKPQTLPVTVTKMARAELDLKVAQEVESSLLAEAERRCRLLYSLGMPSR